MQVSILSERRVIPPHGMAGGENGKRGLNLWVRSDEDGSTRTISMGGKATVMMEKGHRVVIMTPGGGGYGNV
jgi:5-oxoprolinase (ATP-hydrolysing)